MRLNALLAFALFVSAAGCGGGASKDRPGPELNASVTGKVTSGGQAVKDALVSFQNPKIGAYGGKVDDSGTYTIPKMAEGDFIITVNPVAPPPMMQATKDGKIPSAPERKDIADKYRNASFSDIKTVIKAGSNTFDIDLK